MVSAEARFRLRPKRIVSWGIDGTMMPQNARSVA
jgi:hypothetical protein